MPRIWIDAAAVLLAATLLLGGLPADEALALVGDGIPVMVPPVMATVPAF